MKCHYVLPGLLLFLSVAAQRASAGSAYAENSYRVRQIFNGKSETKLDIQETYSGERKAGSTAIKREWGTTTVTESANGRNFVETDRFDITTRSYSRERGDFLRTTNINVTESYDFSGFEKSHRVTSGFDF